MLKIQRTSNGEVVLTLSGQMNAENVGELKTLLSAEASERHIVLDLKDLTLADRHVVSFLRRRETAGTQLKHCPAYIREWINAEQQSGEKPE